MALGHLHRWRGAVLLMCAGVCAAARPARAVEVEQGFPQTPGFHNLHFAGSIAMSYVVYVPEGYDGRAPRPLIVYLHGGGESGTDLGGIYYLGPVAELHKNPQLQKGFESLVLAPQCPPRGQRWDQPQMTQAVLDLVVQTCAHWKVERDREYITGFSMGGQGACVVAQLAPDRFAGISVMSMFDMPKIEFSVLSKMAVWDVSGALDSQCMQVAQTIAAEVEKRGGQVHTHYVPYGGHGNESWVDYASPDMYKWLLEHRRGGRAGAAPATGVVPSPVDGLQLGALASVGRQLETATRFKPILEHLGVVAAGSKDAEEVAEAKEILARVDQWAKNELAQAKELEASAPGDAQTVYRFLSTRMAGTPSGAAADERLGDKEFGENVKAWAYYLRMLAAQKSIRDTPGANGPTDPKFIAANQTYLDSIRELGRELAKTYPNTVACREAQKMLGKYGMTPAGT